MDNGHQSSRQKSRNPSNCQEKACVNKIFDNLKEEGHQSARQKCRNPSNCQEKVRVKKILDDLEEEDGFYEIGDKSAPRKRLNKAKWKQNQLNQCKRDNYENQATNSLPDCGHKNGKKKRQKNERFKCGQVSVKDVVTIRKIYANHEKTVDQNRYILSQVTVDPVARHRPKNKSRSPKNVDPKFFLRLESKKRVRVCKKAFCKVIGVGRGRLTRLIKHYHKHGEAKHEGRGGDHKISKYGEKRQSVYNFISKLKARESHYGRNKSCRLYLPHELKSKKNLCRIYNLNHENSRQVECAFFSKIFNNRFNLAFGIPRTDVCSFCLRHKHLLSIEKDPQKKMMVRGLLRAHKLRGKAFYKLLKQREPGVKTFAGDCMQNQAMPKIPDQATYFSRQLNYYNFTIAEPVKKNEMEHFGYTWTEDQAKKGSNQIASAMCHRLMNTNFDGIHTMRFFADGCGGQNKNVQVFCMASWWLANKAPKSVHTVQLVYPVTGHSYLPPDRVFGRIEKSIRKEEEILSPADYEEIAKKHETVLQMGRDWQVRDWKTFTTERFKSAASLPFKITETKIFEIKKSDPKTVKIKAEANYRHADATFGPACKPGMKNLF